jgi:hypothetical protein
MTTGFQDALKTGDLNALRAIPKSDLQDHAFAAGHRGLVSESRDGILRLSIGHSPPWPRWVHRSRIDWARYSAAKGTLEVLRGLARASKIRQCYAPGVLVISLFNHDAANRELVAVHESSPPYRMAKDSGLRLKTQVGEWGSADDVWRAVEELEVDEVQHGIAAARVHPGDAQAPCHL